MAHFPISRLEKILTADPYCSKLRLLYGVDNVPIEPPNDKEESSEETIIEKEDCVCCIL